MYLQRLLHHKSTQNTLIFIDLEIKLFNSPNNEGFISRIAHNVSEVAAPVETGTEYVTREHCHGGKIL